MGRALSFIPLPLRIVAVVLVGVLVVSLFGGGGGSSGGSGGGAGVAGGVFMLAAILLWLIVLLTLMYEFGWLNALSSVPVLSGFLGFMSNRGAASRGDVSPADQGPKGKLSDSDRRRMETEARAALESLVGADAARVQIQQRLIEPASDDSANPFGTQAPGLVAVFAGPRGVGRTAAAVATARLLAGRGALESGNVVTVRDVDLRSGAHGTPAALASASGQQAVGGMLLLEEAGWLMEADPYGGPGPGGDFGQALLDVIQRNPHKLVVGMTLSEEQAGRLMQRPEIARWLGKLTLRTIYFDDFDDAALLDVVQQRLDAAGWELADDPSAIMLRRMMGEVRARAGDAFDNSEACRRVAETLVEIARTEGDEAKAQARVIDRDILRLADDQLE